MLFMLAARWADECGRDVLPRGQEHLPLINLPFKPPGQPAELQIKEPEPVNILTALAENVGVVRNGTDPQRKAIALVWLFHLVGDIHQPLHSSPAIHG